MGRKYQNNYSTTITTASVGTGDLTFDVTTAPNALAAGEYYHLTITDSLTSPTKTEIVKCTAIATNTLTVVREQEGTTAQTWVTGDYVELRATASGFESPDGATFKDSRETVFAATSSSFDVANGNFQTRTAAGNETIEITMAASEGSILIVDYIPGAHTISFGTSIDEWVGGTAPSTIEAKHRFVFTSTDGGTTITGQSVGGIS